MKKRLLITSIVMMLVVAVALSTATYAWFTSNASVTANSINMTAATSTASAIGIAWEKSDGAVGTAAFNAGYGTEILPYTMGAAIQPAAPAGLNNITSNVAPTFFTAEINSLDQFKSAGASTPVYRMANNANDQAADYSNEVHIANLAQAGPQTVYLTATIDGDIYVAIDTTANENAGEVANTAVYTYYNSSKVALDPQPENGAHLTEAGFKKMNADAVSLIRIAVFEVTNNHTVYTYKGLLSHTAAVDGDDDGNDPDPNTAVGPIESGNDATALITYASTTELNLGVFEAQEDKGYAIYIWMDGQLFTEAFSAKSARIALNFSTTQTTQGTLTEING